jgi:tRNA A37 threonylcarbamoyladenosine synthetase subunit TsaC/SUA5/YrdC
MRLVLDDHNPAPRRIQQIAEALEGGGVIAYPTDTVYGLGADLMNKRAIDRIYEIRRMDRQKPLSLVCADLSAISRYAQVSDSAYRLMRRLLPGPYTFILEATKLVPNLLLRPSRELAAMVFEEKHEAGETDDEEAEVDQRGTVERLRDRKGRRSGAVSVAKGPQLPKREKTVGIRVPDSAICRAIVEALGRPLVNTSCVVGGDLLRDPQEIDERLGKQLSLVVDAGLGGDESSTVVSLVGDVVEVLREGKGAVDALV